MSRVLLKSKESAPRDVVPAEEIVPTDSAQGVDDDLLPKQTETDKDSSNVQGSTLSPVHEVMDTS